MAGQTTATETGSGPGSGGPAKPRIVVVGGGFGGLESAYSLRSRAGDRAAITLVSDSDRFYFKPNSIYVPFGLDPAKLIVPLDRAMRRRDIELVRGRATEIDPDSRSVMVDGKRVGYDFLVVATGAGMRAEEVAGLAEHGLSTWTADDMVALREAFEGLLAAARRGDRRRVVFLIPPQNKCSGPLYEIVLMLDTWLRRHHPARMPEISWTTYEAGFIQAFGPRLHDLVAGEFERRGIRGHTEYIVEQVSADEVRYANGERLGYDLLVAFPPYVPAQAFDGLPTDERGFLATELETRRVTGHPEIYAVGDAGDFPVKQAFLAFLQADAAAADLASSALGERKSERFDPISMCVMEQFDKATFAKVPLRLTGDPERPIEVRPGAEADYQVGSSKAWRMGKKMLGLSVPWRFRNGRPFHGGVFWDAMEIGLGGMARLFASAGGPGGPRGA